MKNIISYLGLNQVVIRSRYSRFDSLSLVSRQSVLAIIVVFLTAFSGNVWGVEFTQGEIKRGKTASNITVSTTGYLNDKNKQICSDGSNIKDSAVVMTSNNFITSGPAYYYVEINAATGYKLSSLGLKISSNSSTAQSIAILCYKGDSAVVAKPDSAYTLAVKANSTTYCDSVTKVKLAVGTKKVRISRLVYINKTTKLPQATSTGATTYGASAGTNIFSLSATAEPVSDGCSAYEFHYGTNEGSDWETECFEQVGETNEWQIEDFTIPSTPNFYVGYHGDGEGGWNSTWSANKAWTDWPTKSDNKWQGQIFLTPNDGALGSFAVGQATGATGTLTIHSNYNDYNKFLSFTPDGYGITYSGSGHAFAETATSNMYETDVVTLPNCTTTYNIGLKTATAGTYVKSIHSKTTDEALSAMGVTIKNGGKKMIYLVPGSFDAAGAVYAVWDCSYNSGAGQWGDGTTKLFTDANSDGIYECPVDANCANIILVRLSSGTTASNIDWGRKWNQTSGSSTISVGDLLQKYEITALDGDNCSYSTTPIHPATGDKGKFRMWANSASENWYVHWVPYYVLSYDGNDGTGTTAQTERNTESSTTTVTVASNGFTAPTGYQFAGWATSQSHADAGTVDYEAGDDYTLTSNATLYAVWTPATYTITLDKGDHGAADQSATVDYDATTVKSITHVTSTGYTLDGYYNGETKVLNADGTFAGSNISGYITSGKWSKADNCTLTAKWTAQTYTITYRDKDDEDFSGYHISGYPTTHTYGAGNTSLNKAVKQGYKFAGWYTASDCASGNKTVLNSTGHTENITLYAKWKEISFAGLSSGTFYGASSMVPDGVTVSSTEQYYPGVTSDERFNLVGVGTSNADDGPMGSKTISSQSLTNTSAVTECLDFKKAATVTSYVPADHAIQFKLGAAGQLEVWANNTIYLSDGSKETEITPSSNYAVVKGLASGTYYLYAKNTSRTLYGIRYKKTHTISLSRNNNSYGTVSADPVTVAEDSTSIITAEPATGYQVTNWAVSGNNSTISPEGASNSNTTTLTMGTANPTVTVTFGAIDYTITHSDPTGDGTYTISVAGGDETDENTTANYGQTITLAATPGEGYAFGSWTITKTSDGSDVTDDVSLSGETDKDATFIMPAYGVTVTATFVESITLYTVTYNANGGSCATSSATQESEGGSLELPTPTWSGYTFDGWYNAGTEVGDAGDDYTPAADITLYAHWTDNISGKLFSYIDGLYGDKYKAFDLSGWVSSSQTGKDKTYTNGTTGVKFVVDDGAWDNKSNSISALAKLVKGTTKDSIIIPTGKIATVKIGYGAFYNSDAKKDYGPLQVNSTDQTGVSTVLEDEMTNAQVESALKEITLNKQKDTLLLGSKSGNVFIGRVSATITGYLIKYLPGANGTGDPITTDTLWVATGSKTLSSSTFTRANYTQDGWSTTDGGDNAYSLGDTYSASAAITLYPHWVLSTHTVTYDDGGADDGVVPVDASSPYTVGSKVTVLGNTGSLTKTEHTFGGWSDGVNTYAAGDKFDMPASDVTLTAVWTINSYNVAVASVDHVTITATPADESTIAEGSNSDVNYGKTVTLAYSSLEAKNYWSGWKVTKNSDGSDVTASVVDGNTLTVPNYNVTISAVTYGDLVAWCDPDITISGDVHLTSAKDVVVYTTNGAGNLLNIKSEDLAGVTSLGIKYLDADNEDAEVGNSSSLFRLCNDGTVNYNVADGSNISVSASNECDLNYSIKYTPNDYDTINHYKLQITMNRTGRPNKVVTYDLYGRALPKEFVIAAKSGDTWYALPNTLAGNEAGQTAITPTAITVDNATTPTKVTNPDGSVVYGATGRYTSANINGIRFTNDGAHYIQISSTSNNYKMWLSSTGGTNLQDWYLKSSDFGAYEVFMDPIGSSSETRRMELYTASDVKMGHHGTRTGTGNIYFLPVEYSKVDEYMSTPSIMEWGTDHVVMELRDEGLAYSYKTQVGGGALSDEVDLYTVRKDYGVYWLPITLATADAAKELKLYFYKSDDAANGVFNFTVPVLISADDANTSDIDSKTAAQCDLVVLNGGVLTVNEISSGTKKTFRDLYIYGGGKLVVPEGKYIDFSNVYMRGGHLNSSWKYQYSNPQLVLNGTMGNTSDTINYDYLTNNAQFYSLALPYPVYLRDIVNPYFNNKQSWEIHAYNGRSRSTGGSGWYDVEVGTGVYPNRIAPLGANDALSVGVGYTFWGAMQKVNLVRQLWSVNRFKMPLASGTAEAEKFGEDEGVDVKAYGMTFNEDSAKYVYDENIRQNNAGWNMVGNPFLADIVGSEDLESSMVGIIIDHHEEKVLDDKGKWTGQKKWVENKTGVRYVRIPHDNGEDYNQVRFKDTTLRAFHHFFIQVALDGKFRIAKAHRAQNAPARVRANGAVLPAEMDIDFVLSNGSDKTSFGLTVNDEFVTTFQAGEDMPDELGGVNIKGYTLVNGERLSYNGLPSDAAEQLIPVGYRAQTAGTYTICHKTGRHDDYIEHIWLTDYILNQTVDLLNGAYEFTSDTGVFDERFALNVVFDRNQLPTDIDEVESYDEDELQPIKFIYNDKMFIRYKNVLYDATGKKVGEIKK